jgi:hypothetical protein
MFIQMEQKLTILRKIVFYLNIHVCVVCESSGIGPSGVVSSDAVASSLTHVACNSAYCSGSLFFYILSDSSIFQTLSDVSSLSVTLHFVYGL